MTQGPGSSEDNAVEGKLSRSAFSGTIARNHSVRFFAGATNHRTTFSSCATHRRTSAHSRAPLRLFAALTFAATARPRSASGFRPTWGRRRRRSCGRRLRRWWRTFRRGGGFGGSHGGGFGGGGGHASGGSSHGAGPAGNGGGSCSGASGHASGGATNSAAHSAPSSRFIGGSTWQAPPSAAMRGGAQPSSHFITPDEAAASGAHVVARPVEPRGISNPLGASTALRGSSFATSNAMRTRPYTAQFVGAPPHVPPFPPRRYPIYPIYGPGFGFGGCFGPFFFGCGGGFYGGGLSGSALAWATVTATAIHSGAARRASTAATITAATTAIRSTTTRPSDSSVSNEFNPSRYWGPSAPPEETGGGGGASSSSSDNEVVLFLKDGTVYAITDYWIADNKLHYITNYGGENSIPLDQLDMQRTVDVNAKRGINITLRPSPQCSKRQHRPTRNRRQMQRRAAPDAQPPANPTRAHRTTATHASPPQPYLSYRWPPAGAFAFVFASPVVHGLPFPNATQAPALHPRTSRYKFFARRI